MVKFMLMLDTTRGEDSTGIVSVNHDGTIDFAKDVGTPWQLMKTKEFSDVFKGFHQAYIGHNRAATKGTVTKENAHPFFFKNVVGVHNGTLRSTYNLDDEKDFQVDSEALYNHMSNNGVKETIKKINGAFALAFYNVEEHSLNLIRNRERPLWFAFTEDNMTVVFASEKWILMVAAMKAGVKIFEPKEVEEDHLYTFPVPKTHNDKCISFNERWSKEQLEVYSCSFYDWSKSSDYSTGNRSYNSSSNHQGSSVTPFRQATKSIAAAMRALIGTEVEFSVAGVSHVGRHNRYIEAETESVPPREIHIYAKENSKLYDNLLASTSTFLGKVNGVGEFNNKPFFILSHDSIRESPNTESKLPVVLDQLDWYGGRSVNAAEWHRITASGCSCCGCQPNTVDHDKLVWYGPNIFVCFQCDRQYEVVDNRDKN